MDDIKPFLTRCMEVIRLITLFKNAIKVKIKICTPVYSDNYGIFCFRVTITVITAVILIERCSSAYICGFLQSYTCSVVVEVSHGTDIVFSHDIGWNQLNQSFNSRASIYSSKDDQNPNYLFASTCGAKQRPNLLYNKL